mmetsp:Transcript_11820/g.18203  ORF Transcript_11820/g.18203 Transcript_11820/m.18203 type:complete len:108 (-) Transcript_11820:1047-1370(-)
MDIIKMKNNVQFDPLIGGVTMTFFPINVVLLPFIFFVILFKTERVSDFILKIQYTYMILMYCLLGFAVSMIIAPLLYLKSIINGCFICWNSKAKSVLDKFILAWNVI